MADEKISALPTDATPSGDDLVVTVNDPAGTPGNRKTTMTDVAQFVASTGTALSGLPASTGDMDSDDTFYGEEDGTPVKWNRLKMLASVAASAGNMDIDDTVFGLEDGVLAVFTRLKLLAGIAAAAGDMDADDTVYGEEDGVQAKFTQAQIVSAARVNTAGAVMESDYDANTILAATADNTPLPLTVAASRHVGRAASGDIDDLTPLQSRVIIGNGIADDDPGVAVSTVAVATTLLASGPLTTGSALEAGDLLKVSAYGNMSNFEGNPRTMLIRMQLNTQQTFSATAYSIANTTIINWEIEGKIPIPSIGAAVATLSPMRLWIGTSTGFVDAPVSKLITAALTIDTTGAITIGLTATPSVSSAALVCTCLGASIDVVRRKF